MSSRKINDTEKRKKLADRARRISSARKKEASLDYELTERARKIAKERHSFPSIHIKCSSGKRLTKEQMIAKMKEKHRVTSSMICS